MNSCSFLRGETCIKVVYLNHKITNFLQAFAWLGHELSPTIHTCVKFCDFSELYLFNCTGFKAVFSAVLIHFCSLLPVKS